MQLRDVARLKTLQNLRAFWELFWVFLTKAEKLCAIFFLIELSGAYDKSVEILCYFRELFKFFGSILKLFWAFLTNFENGTEILCNFLKTPEFGRSPKIWEPATLLGVHIQQSMLDM